MTTRGIALSRRGNAAEALAPLEQALAAARVPPEDPRLEGHAVVELSRCDAHLGRNDDSLAKAGAALALARAFHLHQLELVALAALGVVHMRQGRLELARPHLESACAIARAMNLRREGQYLGLLANLHAVEGRTDEARRDYEAGLVLARGCLDRGAEVGLLSNLGLLEQAQGRTDEARRCFLAALALSRDQGRRLDEAVAHGSLARLAQSVSRVEEARGHYEEALAVFRELGDGWQEGITLGNLGHLEMNLGRTEVARSLLERALALHRELGFTYGQAYWLIGLAKINVAEGSGGWRALADEAVVVSGPYPAVHAESLGQRAKLRNDQGDTAGARADIDRARALEQRGAVALTVAYSDALICLAEGRQEAALVAVREAEELADASGMPADSPTRRELAAVRVRAGAS